MRPIRTRANDPSQDRRETTGRRRGATPAETAVGNSSEVDLLIAITDRAEPRGVFSSDLATSLQRTYGNQHVQRLVKLRNTRSTSAALVPPVQRNYLQGGTKVTGDTFKYDLPGVIPAVKVVSFVHRHTITGFLRSNVAKDLNTVVLKEVEMTNVALAAYNLAWKPGLGRLNVTDGATFVSEGITWGITAMPSDNSIHIWPESGSADTIDITRKEKAPLSAYMNKRRSGSSHPDAETFAREILGRLNGSQVTFDACVAALIAMKEI
jgi:hypothetical protein